jgi:hypothetical protein
MRSARSCAGGPCAALSSRAIMRGRPLAMVTSRAAIRVQVTKVNALTDEILADKRGVWGRERVGRGADGVATSPRRYVLWMDACWCCCMTPSWAGGHRVLLRQSTLGRVNAELEW